MAALSVYGSFRFLIRFLRWLTQEDEEDLSADARSSQFLGRSQEDMNVFAGGKTREDDEMVVSVSFNCLTICLLPSMEEKLELSAELSLEALLGGFAQLVAEYVRNCLFHYLKPLNLKVSLTIFPLSP